MPHCRTAASPARPGSALRRRSMVFGSPSPAHSAALPSAERGGDPEVVRESQRRRYKDVGLVDRVLELDAKWREGEPCCMHALPLSRAHTLFVSNMRGALHSDLPAHPLCSVAFRGCCNLQLALLRFATRAALARPRQFTRCARPRPAARGNLDTLNMDFNKLNKEIAALRKVRR